MTDSTELVPPPHLSPSSIGTFQQCPLKFKYAKIDKLVDPPTEATVLGNFVHDVLEDLYNLPPEERTLDVAKSLMRAQWDSSWGEEAKSVSLTGNMREFQWRAWWCVEGCFKLENPQVLKPSGLEEKVEGFIGDQKILGFIDRWSMKDDGKIIISDYKTGKVPSPKYSKDKFFQLLLYSVLLSPIKGAEVEELELLYVAHAKRLTLKVEPEKLEATKETVTKVSNGIRIRCESGNFEPQQSKLCNWCNYKSFCPAWNN
jgi:putative RecB family exonuclease